MTKSKNKLTRADELCIQVYTNNGGKKTEAFRKAFPKRAAKWKPETVNNKAYIFFKRDDIRARLAQISEKIQKETEIDAEYILRRLHAIESFDLTQMYNDDGTLKKVCDWPEAAGLLVSGIKTSTTNLGDAGDITVKEIKLESRAKALELMGKTVKVKAFDTSVDLKMPEGVTFHLNLGGKT